MNESRKIEARYKKKEEDSSILKRIDEIYSIETRYAIIMAIDSFGSSNIKKLARILGKNDATIYYHIKELTKKPELLKIDEEMTHSHKGIYYELTDLAKEYFGEVTPETIEKVSTKLFDKLSKRSDEEITAFYLDLLQKFPDLDRSIKRDRQRIAYNHILESFMVNNFERAGKALKEGAKPKNKRYPLGSFTIYNIEMKVSTPRHLFEILKVISEMLGKMFHLKEKVNKEMNDQDIPEDERIDVHFHIMGGEIAEFEFEY